MELSPKAWKVVIQSLTSYQIGLAKASLQTDDEELKLMLENDIQFAKEIVRDIQKQKEN